MCALALRQAAGRGSRGRDWQSAEGNLHLSVLLRPVGAARRAGQWSLLAAVALADALAPLLPEPGLLTLKWPNDVRLGGRKLAGVLLDSAADSGGALAWLVIGFGVNLAVAPRLSGVEAAALAEAVRPPAPEALRAAAARRARHLATAVRGRGVRGGAGGVAGAGRRRREAR